MTVTLSEFVNQQFAWKWLNGGSLRIPEPYRFFEYPDEFGDRVGHLLMEYLPGRTPTCSESMPTSDAVLVTQAIKTMHERSRQVNAAMPGPPSRDKAQGFP